MATQSSTLNIILRALVAITVIAVLLLIPSPIIPPHYWAEEIQAYTGAPWKIAYLVAAIGLQAAVFFAIGVLSAFMVKRAETWQRRLSQIITVPLIVVSFELIIRSLKMGHFPVWVNAVVPVCACVAGVWVGLGFLYRRGTGMIVFTVIVAGVMLWALSGSITPELTKATENQLKQMTASSQSLPRGDAKFGALLKIAFTTSSDSLSLSSSAIQQNRASILALGIALGDARLSKFVDLDHKKKLLKEVPPLKKGITLRNRHDWCQHFCLSAALTVLENPLVSDAGGLMKEQLDALSGGSGFSFGDYTADRAGVRFALAATQSEEAAKAMQDFLRRKFDVDNFMPPAADLPENLTAEEFRKQYGATGSALYRKQVSIIESRLDSCAALSPIR